MSLDVQRKLLERRTSCKIPLNAKAVIEVLDRKIEKRKSEYKSATIEQKHRIELVRYRLSTVLDLKKLQLHPKNAKDSHINCIVKSKVKNYLRNKEIRDAKYSNPPLDKIHMATLEPVKFEARHGSVCNHRDTI